MRFLKRLDDEGKIKIVEPSEDICNAYLEKSQKSMISAKTLLDIGNYDDALALTYFSMYYCSLAILYRCGIKSENHTGTIMLLKELFSIDNSSILQAKKDRIDTQYYVDFNAQQKETMEKVKVAEEFNTTVRERIALMKKGEVKMYNEKAKIILGE